MTERFLYDNTGGVLKTLHVEDTSKGDFYGHMEITYDKARMRREVELAREVADPKAGYRHVGRMPPDIHALSMAQGWDDLDIKAWLNNPEYAALRVCGGVI